MDRRPSRDLQDAAGMFQQRTCNCAVGVLMTEPPRWGLKGILLLEESTGTLNMSRGRGRNK